MIWFICGNRFPDRPVNFNDMKKDEMIIMMKHIVMFKFQAEANGKTAMENAAAAKEKAEQLPAQIPQLKKLEVRLNSPSADPTNYEFALICDFETIDDLNTYQVHPAHVAFGQFIKPLREARACIDYEY